jgi:hypothetical protein
MTEFEMAYLQNDMLIGLGSGASYFFAMLTAFVVASYLVAHRLTKEMAAIVVGIFIVASCGSIVTMYRVMDSLAGLGREMKAFAGAGKGLAWHGITRTPEWGLESARYLGSALFIVATIAAVYFFFHSRRVNRKAEAGGWHPKTPT